MLGSEERPRTEVSVKISTDMLEDLEKVVHEKEMSDIELLGA